MLRRWPRFAATVAVMKLSQRYLDLMDIYEECLLLRDVLRRINESLDDARDAGLKDEPVFWVPKFSAAYRMVPYLEVSYSTMRAAEAAVDAAIHRYSEQWSATVGVNDEIAHMLGRQGFPKPSDMRGSAWHYPKTPRILRFFKGSPQAGVVQTDRPHGEKYRAINSPDLSQAVEIERAAPWRAGRAQAAAQIR